MLSVPRYGGLDLPVYDADSVLTDVRSLQSSEPADTLSPTTFLRNIRLSLASDTLNVPTNLTHLLQRTDEELEIVADLCDAQVVEHQWGLLHDPDGAHQPEGGLKGLLPEDHHLVAEVDIIRGAVDVDMHPLNAYRIFRRTGLGALKLAVGLKRYDRQRHQRAYHLNDMMPSQFVVGSSTAAGDNKESFWLIDIEPRLAF